MTHYCTYFDRNFLIRGLALYRSMVEHCRPFLLHVLCLDDETHAYLTATGRPGINPIRLADLERADPELLAVKSRRSLIEYYFTCTPALPLHVFATHPGAASVTYIDADFYFFGDPAPFGRALAARPVVIVPHRLPERLRHLEVYGTYNVGILGFRNDAVGRECLGWWRARCLEWCHDRLEDGKFADQKYLDALPTLFAGTAVLDHKGVNLAPWNVANYRIGLRNGSVTIDGDELVCYHFHNFRVLNRYLYQLGLREYGVRLSPVLARHIYRPYLQTIRGLMRDGHRAPHGLRTRWSAVGQLTRLLDRRPLVVSVGDLIAGL